MLAGFVFLLSTKLNIICVLQFLSDRDEKGNVLFGFASKAGYDFLNVHLYPIYVPRPFLRPPSSRLVFNFGFETVHEEALRIPTSRPTSWKTKLQYLFSTETVFNFAREVIEDTNIFLI